MNKVWHSAVVDPTGQTIRTTLRDDTPELFTQAQIEAVARYYGGPSCDVYFDRHTNLFWIAGNTEPVARLLITEVDIGSGINV